MSAIPGGGGPPGLEYWKDGKPPPLKLSVLWRIYGYLRPYRALRNATFLFSGMRAIQRPLMGLAIAAIINGPIARGNYEQLWLACLGFLGLALFTEVTFHYRWKFSLKIGERVTQDLRRDLFAKFQAMTLSFYGEMKLGSLLSRFISDIENVRRGVQSSFFFATMMLGQMLVAAICMAIYNTALFVVVLFVGPIVFLLSRYFRSRLSHWSRQTQLSQSRLTGKIAESVNGMKIIQAFTREQETAREFQLLTSAHASNNRNLARNAAVYIPLLEINSQATLSILLSVGAYGAFTGSFGASVDDYIAFFFLANFFFAPIQNIARVYTMALAAMAGAERVFELLDRDPEWNEGTGLAQPKSFEGRIQAKNLSFGYSDDKLALEEVDFDFQPGESIALVGHTGSGKSTLASLICKFYRPTSGALLIDGMPVEDIDGHALRRRFGLVTQTPFLFEGSVLENIRYSRPEASEKTARRALEALGCAEMLEGLPEGLLTQVGENGRNISSGQRQLVCFARAMLADPAVLILDEATSFVDAVTEQRIQKAMRRLMEGRTSFVIAHRLSVATEVDHILVLRDGKIVERGVHAALLEQKGYYAELYREFSISHSAAS